MNTPKYIATLEKPLGIIPAGSFICERQLAAKLLSLSPEVELTRLELGDYVPLAATEADARDTILFVRPGGFGDMLFLTPTLRAIKARLPHCRLVVACFPDFAPALRGNPDVDQIVAYPVPVEEWVKADAHVWLEGILEEGEDAKTTNAVELIAAEAGEELADLTMRYDVAEGERAWARETYPKQAKPRIGIQVQASAENRTYPFEHLEKVANELVKRGCEVLFMGNPGSVDADEPFVNLTKDKLNFRQSCAVVETCDAFLAPDSALCHVAGALNVPTVALFGPFPSAIRTAHQPSVAAIDGHAPCAPCFHLGNPANPWPENCPGNKTGRCAALGNIDPKRVVNAVLISLAAAVHQPINGSDV